MGCGVPYFFVLGDENDVLCNGRGCVAVYRLPVCRWFCFVGFAGDAVDDLES